MALIMQMSLLMGSGGDIGDWLIDDSLSAGWCPMLTGDVRVEIKQSLLSHTLPANIHGNTIPCLLYSTVAICQRDQMQQLSD